MIKISTFYKKKPQYDSNEFRQNMLTYVNKANQDPDINGYCVNFVNDVRTLNIDPVQMGYDATSENWINLKDGIEPFHFQPKVKGIDIEQMCLRKTTFLTEEHIILKGPSVPTNLKLVVLLQRRSDLSANEWREWWLKHAQLTAQMPGLRAYRINFISKAENSYLEKLGISFDGTAQLWFDSLADMESGFGSSIGKKASEDSDNHCGKRARFLTEEYCIV